MVLKKKNIALDEEEWCKFRSNAIRRGKPAAEALRDVIAEKNREWEAAA